MRTQLWIAAALGLVVLLIIYFTKSVAGGYGENYSRKEQKIASSPPVRQSALPSKGAQSAPFMDDEIIQTPSHPSAIAFGSDATQAADEARQLYDLFNFYRESFGSFPSGEGNAQFMNALRGENPDRLPIFPGNHSRLNSEGALLDFWNTEFFFHQIAADRIEIRSAGPDSEFYTVDDIVAPMRQTYPQKDRKE